MSLEQSIQDLTVAVVALTAAMNQANSNQTQSVSTITEAATHLAAAIEDTKVEVAAPTPKKEKKVKKEAPQVEEVKEAPKSLFADSQPEPEKTVTADDCQALCLELVKVDRSKKDTIKAVIASFDGASVIKEVPVEKLHQLYAKLEDLR